MVRHFLTPGERMPWTVEAVGRHHKGLSDPKTQHRVVTGALGREER
jgi:hypothetical protein